MALPLKKTVYDAEADRKISFMPNLIGDLSRVENENRADVAKRMSLSPEWDRQSLPAAPAAPAAVATKAKSSPDNSFIPELPAPTATYDKAGTANSFEPLQYAGKTALLKGVSAKGNPSYGDQAFVDSMANGNVHAGVTTLPSQPMPESKVTTLNSLPLPATPPQNMAYQAQPLNSLVDPTQARKVIADNLAALNAANGKDGASLLKAKYANHALGLLLGYDASSRGSQNQMNELGQSESQFQQTKAQRAQEKAREDAFTEQDFGLKNKMFAENTAMNQEKMRLAGLPLPAKPPQPPKLVNYTNADGTTVSMNQLPDGTLEKPVLSKKTQFDTEVAAEQARIDAEPDVAKKAEAQRQLNMAISRFKA